MKKPLNIGAEKEIMSKNKKEIVDKIEWEYEENLRRWRILQGDFDFQRQTFHNIHLKSTLNSMLIVLDRLQMLAFLLEKWNDD